MMFAVVRSKFDNSEFHSRIELRYNDQGFLNTPLALDIARREILKTHERLRDCECESHIIVSISEGNA